MSERLQSHFYSINRIGLVEVIGLEAVLCHELRAVEGGLLCQRNWSRSDFQIQGPSDDLCLS